MISLKRYLDEDDRGFAKSGEVEDPSCERLISAYCATLNHIVECGARLCPDLAGDLTRNVERISESLRASASPEAVASSEVAVRDTLREWGRSAARYHERGLTDVKDLLLVMSRTAEALGVKDDQFARELDGITSQLSSISRLEDVSRMRVSIESSALELRHSVQKLAVESRALIEHLRLEVSTYQTKLQRAEYMASRDTLTGLASRNWIETCIQDRIETGSSFSIVLIDIDGFGQIVERYGNLVGDMLLKEFARELRCACRFTDAVGRWGSDEFILIVENSGQEVAGQLLRLAAWIARAYHVPGRTGYVNVQLTASLGAAEYRMGEDVQELLERADLELCKQKGSGSRQKTA